MEKLVQLRKEACSLPEAKLQFSQLEESVPAALTSTAKKIAKVEAIAAKKQDLPRSCQSRQNLTQQKVIQNLWTGQHKKRSLKRGRQCDCRLGFAGVRVKSKMDSFVGIQ